MKICFLGWGILITLSCKKWGILITLNYFYWGFLITQITNMWGIVITLDIELILNNLHRAQINRDGIVVQIGVGTYYVYFKTISKLIELVKDIEVHDNSVIYILAIVVKRLIHEMREKAGF